MALSSTATNAQAQENIDAIQDIVAKFGELNDIDDFKFQAGAVIGEQRVWVTLEKRSA